MVESHRPFLTVIIPHFNQPAALRDCLASLTLQSFNSSQFEVIVVDNGSREPIDHICAQFPNVRLLHESTAGPGPARNTGIKAARADILAFIDADCLADSEWIAAGLRALSDQNSTGVLGGDVRIGFVCPNRATAIEAYESVFAFRQKMYIERHGYSGTGNLMVRRTIMEKIGGFAGIGIAEDADWGHRASAAGVPAQFADDMIVFHPARRSFSELAAKWDRHIDHGFAELKPGVAARLRWCARAVAVLLSTIPHIGVLLFSPRCPRLIDRIRGIGILARIRFYRFWAMVSRTRSSKNDWSR